MRVSITQLPENPHPEVLPPALAAVALVDARTCAAAGSMSESWWHEEVRAGRAPQPAIRAPRCTRWRAADVADFWLDFASQGSDPQQGERMHTLTVRSARARGQTAKAALPLIAPASRALGVAACRRHRGHRGDDGGVEHDQQPL